MTPMLQQYFQIKEEYKDALLFFRMGDFYELFFEDAQLAARELQITLTARNPNDEQKMPMCGVPYHSTEDYLRQLLEKGYKVAICDQIEDPRQAKGLVKRAVTRVLTPGTIVEDSSLDSKEHNYLAALCWNNESSNGGLTWIDFSTGEWQGLFSKQQNQLWQWVAKIQPSELLIPEGMEYPSAFLEGFSTRVNAVPFTAYFDLQQASKKIMHALGVNSLDSLDLGDKPALLQSCGAVLSYLYQTQKQELVRFSDFKLLNLSKHLLLDEVTERNLELFKRLDGKKGSGTLWHVLDRTLTPMGGRLLQARLREPWRELNAILPQQEAVCYLNADDALRNMLREKLDRVYDLERLSMRIFLNRCTPKDFVALRKSLQIVPEIRNLFINKQAEQTTSGALERILKKWDNLKDIYELLKGSIVDSPPPLITEGGLFQSAYCQELDELLELTEHGEGKLQELLNKEQQNQELPKLKLGYNRVFGYYFELSKAHKGAVPEHFIRRQTLVNSERYITPELKDLEDKLFSASEKRKSLEYKLFSELREAIAAKRERFAAMASILAQIDVWQGLAECARLWEWTCPDLHTGMDMHIQGGRHPAVEASQGRSDYIPNDLHLDEKSRILLITGPNMAGKSTVLRQAALISILAQIGSFVPAHKCSLGICDRIFTRVGASDNLSQGQSTFMVEMTETARILRQAGKRSLVVLDEIGRGTSTFDGLALAWAVVEDLARKHQQPVRTLFATHYHELTDLEGKIPGVRNYNIAVKEWRGEIIFLRRMVPGPADRSYGIEVAKLAGVPRNVVQRAKEILRELEEKSTHLRATKKKSPGTVQTLLPGLTPKKSLSEPTKQAKKHPLLEELQKVETEHLAPLEALNLLNNWKKKWVDDDFENN